MDAANGLGKVARSVTFVTKSATASQQIVVVVGLFGGSNASKLRQVLINLIGSAIKFTEYGNATLRVKTENGGSKTLKTLKLIPGRETDISFEFKTQDLIFEVEDTGRGMSAEELNRVFSVDDLTQTPKNHP